MQTLVEAASHIAQEIERTRQHLTNLEQALQGLRPLITIDAATTALPFTTTPPVQSVEDVSVVNVEVPGKKVVKLKRTAKPVKAKAQTQAAAKAVIPKKTKAKIERSLNQTVKVSQTGAELWLSCLGRKKLSTTELIEEAMKKLDLDASSRVVIANRARAWLNASVKGGTVSAAGMRDGINLYKRTVAKVSK
jgi:hypothetical protein